MILAPLAAAALVISVATSPMTDPNAAAPISAAQRSAAIAPLVRSATDCIARSVNADPRYRKQDTDLGDLIVDSMTICLPQVRALIAGYDRYFGEGAGEAFFMGPYLDVLPIAVEKWAKDRTQ
jgi:hypothetical protein